MGVTSLKAALFIVIVVRTTNPLACLMHYPQDFGTVLRDDVRAVLELQLSVLLHRRGRWRPVTAIATKLVFTSNYRERWLHTLILVSLHRWQDNPIYTLLLNATNGIYPLVPHLTCRWCWNFLSLNVEDTRIYKYEWGSLIASFIFSP